MKALEYLKKQCEDILIILDNWSLENPSTYRVLSNTIKELQKVLKPLSIIERSCNTIYFKEALEKKQEKKSVNNTKYSVLYTLSLLYNLVLTPYRYSVEFNL